MSFKYSLKEEVYTSLKAKGSKRFAINYQEEAQRMNLPVGIYERRIDELIDDGKLTKPVQTSVGCVVTIE